MSRPIDCSAWAHVYLLWEVVLLLTLFFYYSIRCVGKNNLYSTERDGGKLTMKQCNFSVSWPTLRYDTIRYDTVGYGTVRFTVRREREQNDIGRLSTR